MIRKALESDIPAILRLLHQVANVHHNARPDLFKGNTTKYDRQELEQILSNECSPVFVYEHEGRAVGYVFCIVEQVESDRLQQDNKTLYVDDLCVDEALRGHHIGTALYRHALAYAREIGCNGLTLNVWEGNSTAIAFYKSMGMCVRKTCMEQILQ